MAMMSSYSSSRIYGELLLLDGIDFSEQQVWCSDKLFFARPSSFSLLITALRGLLRTQVNLPLAVQWSGTRIPIGNCSRNIMVSTRSE